MFCLITAVTKLLSILRCKCTMYRSGMLTIAGSWIFSVLPAVQRRYTYRALYASQKHKWANTQSADCSQVPNVYSSVGAVYRSEVWVCDSALIIMGLWTSCGRRGRRIFTWTPLKSWLMVISGTSLTLSVQRLTCYGGLLPASNKLSSFLHLSWGSLVSCVWQAAFLQVRLQPREGRASSRGKLSSFCQTTGKRRSLSLPLFLCLSLTLYLSFSLCQPVPLVQIFTFPVPVMLLSAWLCRINRRVSEDETPNVP